MDWWVIPALTSGPLGFFDQGDPNVTTLLGDTPGPLGFNDANDPSIGPFGSALEYAMFLSAGPFDSSLGIDSTDGRVAAIASAKPSSSAWARTEPSRVPAWNPAAADRVMGNLLANSERFADNKSAPGMWDRITEKGKAVWDSTGEAVDDAGRALRRAVTIDSPAEARARSDEIALRRTQNRVAADLRAHGWGDNGLACVRLGSTAMAIQPASVNPAYYDSFDQRIAWSTNEALQLYAGGALIDAVAIPILTVGGKLAVRFLSQEAKLSHGLRQELRSSHKIVKGDGIEPARANRKSNASGLTDSGSEALQQGAEAQIKGGAPEVRAGASAAVDTAALANAGKSASGTAIQTYWPSNNGFLGTPVPQTLEAGYQFNRYGGFFDETGAFQDFGAFVAPTEVPYGMRALPPGTNIAKPLSTYEVIRPISDVPTGPAAPAFGELGLGTQHQLPMTIQDYLDQGYIKLIDQTVPKKP
jgi:hypothetical protein